MTSPLAGGISQWRRRPAAAVATQEQERLSLWGRANADDDDGGDGDDGDDDGDDDIGEDADDLDKTMD